jgi:large subunit ribosomal protein L21
MYAVIRTGGKQYRVAPEDIIEVEKLAGDAGEIVQFGEVLMLAGDGAPQIGAPTVSGASVAGQIVEQKRGQKIIVFKKKRRKNYRRKKGHRQHLTAVRITEILTGGKKPSKAAAAPAPKKDEKPKASAKTEKPKAQAKAKAAPRAEAKEAPAKKPAAKKPAAKK